MMNSCRADHIGSLLRPGFLLDAREQHAAANLSDAEFKQLEDRAVDEAIALQERAGIDVISDGEQRRNVFASQLVQACDGFASVRDNTVDWFRLDGTTETSPVTVGVVSKIKRRRSLSSEEFVYLRARTRRPAKITIPSPTMYAYYWVPGISDAAYRSPDAYLEDVTDVLKDDVGDLVQLGAEYVQIDAPELGMLLDPHQQEWFARKGFDPERLIDQGLELINAVIGDHPRALFGLHICRGNDTGRYMAKGSYASIAKRVFGTTKATRLLLEYDDERSGDFAPLAEVPDDKTVVLGLVTTKTPRVESAEELRERIRMASAYVPLERLALSPQCGFASVARGNPVTSEVQEKKLRLVAEIARQVWHG